MSDSGDAMIVEVVSKLSEAELPGIGYIDPDVHIRAILRWASADMEDLLPPMSSWKQAVEKLDDFLVENGAVEGMKIDHSDLIEISDSLIRHLTLRVLAAVSVYFMKGWATFMKELPEEIKVGFLEVFEPYRQNFKGELMSAFTSNIAAREEEKKMAKMMDNIETQRLSAIESLQKMVVDNNELREENTKLKRAMQEDESVRRKYLEEIESKEQQVLYEKEENNKLRKILTEMKRNLDDAKASQVRAEETTNVYNNQLIAAQIDLQRYKNKESYWQQRNEEFEDALNRLDALSNIEKQYQSLKTEFDRSKEAINNLRHNLNNANLMVQELLKSQENEKIEKENQIRDNMRLYSELQLLEKSHRELKQQLALYRSKTNNVFIDDMSSLAVPPIAEKGRSSVLISDTHKSLEQSKKSVSNFHEVALKARDEELVNVRQSLVLIQQKEKEWQLKCEKQAEEIAKLKQGLTNPGFLPINTQEMDFEDRLKQSLLTKDQEMSTLIERSNLQSEQQSKVINQLRLKLSDLESQIKSKPPIEVSSSTTLENYQVIYSSMMSYVLEHLDVPGERQKTVKAIKRDLQKSFSVSKLLL